MNESEVKEMKGTGVRGDEGIEGIKWVERTK